MIVATSEDPPAAPAGMSTVTEKVVLAKAARVTVISDDLHFTFTLFPDDAPKLVADFLNTVRIDALRDSPFTPDEGEKRYRITVSPPMPAKFPRVVNDLELERGSLVIAVNADGVPLLNEFFILNEEKEQLAALKDQYLVIGKIDPVLELDRLTDESTVTRTVEVLEREDVGALNDE